MAKLSTKARNALPSSAFVFPKDKRYPIHDESHARNALARASGKPEEAKVRAAVHRRYPNIGKAEFESVVDLIKAESQHLVYGVVLTPGLEDSQGDTVDAVEVEKAAHKWMEEYRTHDVQHDGVEALVVPVESFIVPDDMEIAGVPVTKGAWVVGARVNDPATWAQIEKQEITGFSIGGTGERLPDDE